VVCGSPCGHSDSSTSPSNGPKSPHPRERGAPAGVLELGMQAKEAAVLRNIADRNARLMVSCRRIARAELTPAEMAAVIPNAALVDRANLRIISQPEGRKSSPIGATDLSNPVNEPEGMVLTHPVVSLHEEIGRCLEDRKAPTSLCREVRDIAVLIDTTHRKSRHLYKLPDEWPIFRALWESEMDRQGALPLSYKKRRPSPGVSPEWIVYRQAACAGVIPDWNKCDPDAIDSALIEQGHKQEGRLAKALSMAKKGQTEAATLLVERERLNTIAIQTFAQTVEVPIVREAKAWAFTSKNFDDKTLDRIDASAKEVQEFAETLPPIERMALHQAAETAHMAVISPSIEDRMSRFGARILSWVAKQGLEKGGEAAADVAKDKAADLVYDQLGTTGKLLFLVSKGIYKAVGSPGAKVLDDKIEKGVEKMTDWARDKMESKAYDEVFAEEVDAKMKQIVDRSPMDKTETSGLVDLLSAEGKRTAAMLGQIYTVWQDPKVRDRFVDRAAKTEVGTFAMLAEQDISPAHQHEPYTDVLGLDMRLTGSPDEVSAASRIAAAGIARNNFPPLSAHLDSRWVKGAERMTHSLEGAKKALNDLSFTLPSSLPEEEQIAIMEKKIQDNLVKAMSYSVDYHTEQLDSTRPLVRDKALSTLLFASEDAIEESFGIKSPSRTARGDWPALVAINVGLAAGSISPSMLQEQLAAPSPFMRPTSADEHRAKAQSLAGEENTSHQRIS